MAFRKIDPREVTDNFIRLIGTDWMLLSAGEKDCCNTMTASWGMAGVLWSRPVTEVFVRPQRHTYGFMEKYGLYTCSFFDSSMRPALAYCGSHSGRDGDKIAAAGLTPVFDEGTVYFEEARLVLVCRRLYSQKIDRKCFCDDSIELEHYPERDFHKAYVGEIVACLVKE